MAYHTIDGALFKEGQRPADGKRYPIMHLALEVLGVKMNVAVWSVETSKNGVKYWPCSGDYARSETRRLVPVTVEQLPTAAPDAVLDPAAPAIAPMEGGTDEATPF